MLLEISTLPPIIQEQILQIQQGETIQFANHGQIIGELVQNHDTANSDSLMATFGLWQKILLMAWRMNASCAVNGIESGNQDFEHLPITLINPIDE